MKHLRQLISASRHACVSGLTLVELLVCISIISILVSLFLPSLKVAKSKMRQMVCLNNLKQLGLAFHNFAAENGEALPFYYSETSNEWGGAGNWTTWLQPYAPAQGPRWGLNRDTYGGVWTCPEVKLQNPDFYGYSYYSTYGCNQMMKYYLIASPKTPVYINSVINQSTAILLMDGFPQNISSPRCLTYTDDRDIDPNHASTRLPMRAVHHGNVLVLYLDGHISSYTQSEKVSGVVNWTIQ